MVFSSMATVKSKPYFNSISNKISSSVLSGLMLLAKASSCSVKWFGLPSQATILLLSSLKALKPMSNLSIPSLSLKSCLIFSPALRMRSLVISAILKYFALYASLFSSVGSGNCTEIHLRLPPSSALSCITAWAVVPEPE